MIFSYSQITYLVTPLKKTALRTVISSVDIRGMALTDLWEGLRRPELWWHFAVHDIKQRYRRSVLGPFWITLSMGIMIGAMGFVFSHLFNQSIDKFLPYLSVGLTFWTFLTSVINESCTAFTSAEGYIKNVPMPLSVHYYRMLSCNLIILAHNMIIVVIVFLSFAHLPGLPLLAFVAGFFFFNAVIISAGLIAAILSTRYRDIPQVITNLLQVVFFITPIFWSVDALPNRPAFVHLNPLYHLLELVRAPLLGKLPDPVSWLVAIGLLCILTPIVIALYRVAWPRIPYWV